MSVVSESKASPSTFPFHQRGEIHHRTGEEINIFILTAASIDHNATLRHCQDIYTVYISCIEYICCIAPQVSLTAL